MLSRFFTALIILLFTTTLFSQSLQIPRVPEWSKSAVWYQIFPERFSNGDKSNDPTPEDIMDSWPYFVPDNWALKSWTSDWYAQDEWEKESGLDFYGNCGLRRYGGDLQGVIDKLDYLANLGINAIYFNPVFESPSLHKYDASMYHHIDNNFGPNPGLDRKIWESENPGDPLTWRWTSADSLFLKLLDEAHERNIKVIIDGVFNHVGNTFWAFKDLQKNQQQSKYKSWFTVKKWDNLQTKENEFDWEGWYGVKDLPEIYEDKNGLIEPFAEHVHDVIKRWMDPNNDGNPSDGIDGWRLDVAEMVNINFWRKFRVWVKEINPNAYITGEIWWDDWAQNKMMNASPWLQGDCFDAVMNYRFTKAVKHFVVNKKEPSGIHGFIDSLNSIATDYNKENLYVLMNLLGSHDVERIASMIVNADLWYDHGGNPGQTDTFHVRKPNPEEIKKQKLMVGLQMTMPGAPMIYYGDEGGLWGGDDPDCRKPMVWPEFKYDDEAGHPFGKERPRDKIFFNETLFNYYSTLTSIRHNNKELSLGDIEFFYTNEIDNTIGYKRKYNGNTIFILVNNSNTPKIVKIPKDKFDNKKKFKELITGSNYEIAGNEMNIRLMPYEIAIYK